MLRVVLILCLTFATLRSPAAQLVVLAAASLTESLRTIGADYQKQVGQVVIFSFGASSTLARQIEEGAPADIFLSADEAQMNRLEKQELLVNTTRRDVLANSLVIIVAAKDGARISAPGDLIRPEIKRIALGDPRLVPAGVYARQYLEKLGLWNQVTTKVVPTENVRGALAAVESGNADAGIVYKTDALVSSGVKVAFAVPGDAGPKIRYPVAIIRGSKQEAAAIEFLNYLSSAAVRKVFEQRGFIMLHESKGQ